MVKFVDAETAAVRRLQEIRAAEDECRSILGTNMLAFDTAADIYKAALTAMGANVADLHPSACKVMYRTLRRSGRRPVMDGAADEAFIKRHPNAAHVRVLD